MSSLHAVMRKFDARDSWESYSRELEHYFEVNRVLNDDERVAILLTVLSPSVYNVLRDSCRPEFPRLKTYAELSELLKIHHSPRPSVFKRRIEFFRATQTPTESLNEWLQRITRLAASCDFGNQFDTVLKENFVSGLANRRLVDILCEKNSSATLGDLVDMAENYAPLCGAETNILDLPDDVLRLIIMLLNARERVPLGNSCRRLKTLVFENPQLLRHLDFSKKSGLTKMTHIRQYFNNENACQHVRRVDANNYVDCIKAGDPLNNSIGRGINLVEVNIHGVQFEDIWQLGSFLNPLQHLQKLSIDWPRNVEHNISICKRILQRPFSKLMYLSVRFDKPATTMFTSSLSVCQQLKELHMKSFEYLGIGICSNSWNSEIKQLTNLKIVQYHGKEAIRIKEELATVLPDPKRWTDFHLCGPTDPIEFYIEKDVEVCEELLQSSRLQEFLNTTPWENFNLGSALNPECLLKEVLRITHEDVPEDLCCLSEFVGGLRHLLKVEEAKLLLRDPRYQISHLYLNHDLERRCDAHLLASAFSNLSELVLDSVRGNLEMLPKDSYFRRRLSRKCSPTSETQDDSLNLDSSFKMLVENTPRLRHFKLMRYSSKIEDWDLGALCLISGWQNLETLCLVFVPCADGQFLVEIGKQCKNLQKLSLKTSTFKEADLDKVALFEMLKYCRNLRDFTIGGYDIDQAEMFATLTKNVELETLEAYGSGTLHSAAPWISSLENMIYQCEKLTTIICETEIETKDDLNEAVSAVKRIKEECHRPDFQINVTLSLNDPGVAPVVIGTASRDFPLRYCII